MRPFNTLATALAVAVVSVTPIAAQDEHDSYPPTTVTVDLDAPELTVALPFYERFHLKVPVPDSVTSVDVQRAAMTWTGNGWAKVDRWTSLTAMTPLRTALVRSKHLVYEVEPLPAKRRYAFRVLYTHPESVGFRHTVDRVDTLTFQGETHATFTDRFVTDVGIAYATRTQYLGAHTAVHWYPFAPINRRAVLGLAPTGNLARRVSVFVGLSPVEFRSDVDMETLYDAGNPTLGVGYRLWRFARLSAGLMFYEQEDPNPLLTRRIGRQDLFLSASFDLDYKSLIAPVAALLGIS